MPDSSPHVKSNLGRALEMEVEAEQAKYLDEACQGNPTPREEIEDLMEPSLLPATFSSKSRQEQPIHDHDRDRPYFVMECMPSPFH